VYVPESEVVFDAFGRAACVLCRLRRARVADEVTVSSPPLSPGRAWVRSLATPVRAAAFAMLVLTLAFPFAACVSQL
jgi:hypothetical protein